MDLLVPPRRAAVTIDTEEHSNDDHTTQLFGQFAGSPEDRPEYRNYYRDQQIFNDATNS